MHPAANLQFERAILEFVRWRAVPDAERSPAPAWWWGPAMEAHWLLTPMPADWCSRLELPENSSCAAGAEVFLGLFADQRFMPWPDEFPRRPGHSGPV